MPIEKFDFCAKVGILMVIDHAATTEGYPRRIYNYDFGFGFTNHHLYWSAFMMVRKAVAVIVYPS